MKVSIVEVGARDGLQNERVSIAVGKKMQFIKLLANSGLKRIEVGAFVSPKWVPQMQGSAQVVNRTFRSMESGALPADLKIAALVPNLRGLQDALKTPIKDVAIFGACSEAFSQKNINCSIEESFQRFAQVIQLAKSKKVKVRGYLSTAFGCPYEGKVSEAKVIRLIERMLGLGVYEVSVGDTIGVATPKQVHSILGKLEKSVGTKKIAMHMHDTRGTALANVLASLDHGVKTFDSSVGGLGGCPYASGALGNLATEDLVYMLTGMGIKTGVDIACLIKAKAWVEKQVGRELPSHVGRAGLPLKGTIF